MLAESRETDDGRSARRCVTAAVRLALHAVRDSLSYEAAMNVGVRLRGRYRDLYYEDWPSASATRLASRSEFVQRVGGPDDPQGPGEFLARLALKRVAEETPYPARAEIRGFLPAHLRPFWPVLRVRGRRRRRTVTAPEHVHLRLVFESRRAS
jgi:uncharacterized protein (DUF2267 family)